MRASLNSMTHNSKNRREVSKWSLKIGGRSIRVVVSTILTVFTFIKLSIAFQQVRRLLTFQIYLFYGGIIWGRVT